MTIANPPKALIALVALICITVLMAIGAISTEAGIPIFTMIVGYAIGNGIAARSGHPVEPIVGRKNDA